ncbi:hypothetical protein TCSYLVIO_007640 [Trypanosoma cruzi]|nr:hypothetical protein TCSYLVIO_007640 [Trypanosoma cruzi]
MFGDPVRPAPAFAVAAVQNAEENMRTKLQRMEGTPLAGSMPTTTWATAIPPLPGSRPAATNAAGQKKECLGANINSCPQFQRLRGTAREDRHEKIFRRTQEAKRAEEIRQRQALLSQSVTMNDYYNTLFRPLQKCDFATTLDSAWSATGNLPAPVGKSLRTRDVVLIDLEESFTAYYYKMHPAALQRKKELEEAEEQRRRSVRAAAQISSFSGGLPRSRSTTLPRGQKSSPKKKKQKGKKEEQPKEGAPAANLRILLEALLEASDDRGMITFDAFIAVLKRPPFEVKDEEALEAFFFLVQTSSTAEVGGSETERRLDGSFSVSAVLPRARRKSASQHTSHVLVTGTSATLGPSSPFTSTGTLPASLRRSATGPGASQSIIRRAAFTSRANKGATTSMTTITLGTAAASEVICSPSVRVREILAAIDAIINGPEIREAVRSVCFGVLESDGFIHKATLHTIRLFRRENCEGKDAVVTPSIVKALGDAMELMLQEEEAEYLRSQMKGKRRAKAGKAPALLAHQKSAIPLHMMRRSHINFKEFSRFFDELPMIAAAFTNVWLPAIFATSWPSVKRSFTSESNDGGMPGDDEEQHNNNAEDGVVDESHAWRRNTARRVVTERLEYMKPASIIESDVVS